MSVEKGRGGVFIVLGLAAALAVAAALFLFDPAQHGFYPRCFFKMSTGLDCPGCGGLRATHQLLHGKIGAAFALNPLFIAAIPFSVYLGARTLVERLTGARWPRLFSTMTAVWIVVAAVFLFGLVRNLPWRAWLGS